LSESLRIQLFFVFAVCLSLAGAGGCRNEQINSHQQKLNWLTLIFTVDKNIDNEALFMLDRFRKHNFNLENFNGKKEIEEFIQQRSMKNSINILITDMLGNVELSAGSSNPSKIDLYDIIKNAMEFQINQKNNNSRTLEKNISVAILSHLLTLKVILF
jgi:hypothetical protein